MTRRMGIIALVALLAAAFALSWWLERKPEPTIEQAVAHERTAAATALSAHADTVFRTDTLRIGAARVSYRTAFDTLRLTDTLMVKAAFAKADTVIRLDSVALADAGRALDAHGVTEQALRTELALALRPRRAPRLITTASALYDPLAGVPAGSVQLSARVIGSFALVARVDQRAILGEKPRSYLGVSLSF